MKTLILAATTSSIEAKMSGSASSDNPDFVVAFADNTGSAFTEGSQDGTLNGTSTVTVCAAPSASTRRIIKSINFHNTDDAEVTITLIYNNNSTLRTLATIVLAVNERWSSDDNHIFTERTVDVVSNVATSTILGRTTGGTGNSEELSPSALRTLINVEDGADVTDTANVTSAGALMDSEVTNLAQVKAFDETDYAAALGTDDNYVTDAEKIVIGNTSGTNTGDQDISAKQNILAEGAFVDGDKTKLDGLGGFTMNLLELTQTTMQQHDSIADLAIEWKTQDTTNANFTHSVSTNSEQITCVTAGWLDVRYAVMYDQDDTDRLNTEAYITLNGTRVEKSVSRKSYYRGVVSAKYGDESRAFYLQVAAGNVIELHSGVADGNTEFNLAREIDTVPTMTNIQIRFLG